MNFTGLLPAEHGALIVNEPQLNRLPIKEKVLYIKKEFLACDGLYISTFTHRNDSAFWLLHLQFDQMPEMSSPQIVFQRSHLHLLMPDRFRIQQYLVRKAVY